MGSAELIAWASSWVELVRKAAVDESRHLAVRAVSLGELKDTKTRAHRTVRLLAPLQDDLQAWRRS